MVIAFFIWSIVTVIFVVIGIGALRAQKEIGFFTFREPPKTTDYLAYNRAVAILWFIFAFLLEIIGIPLLFIEQNSPIAIFIVLGTMFLVIGIMIAYIQIEKKFRAQNSEVSG